MIKVYIAHKNEENGEKQSVQAHLIETAELAREYAIGPFKDIAYAMGLLHDIGKYQPSFQKKINGNNSIRVEHSACGAIAANEKYKGIPLAIIQYGILGHHSGIPDGGTKSDTADMPTRIGRLKRNFEDYSAYKNEISLPDIDIHALQPLIAGIESVDEKIEITAFFTRYCFSCLTDADSINTASFCNSAEDVEMKSDFKKCLEKINSKLSSFECTTELQRARSQIQSQVFEKTKIDSEIYLINMPTGSGKTLCSMKFALERAIEKKMRRIIYVIPYNSIIDQTARLFEELFGDDAQILRHQSTYSYDDADFSEDYKNVVRSASENWNAQIIITTAVQFFESSYANKRGRLRKMHNMAQSIIVFDEVHLMNTDYLQPCLRAITYTTRFLNSEAVFLTATMPDYEKLIRTYALPNSKVCSLVQDTSLFEKFKKCTYKNLGPISQEELLIKAQSSPSSLIVVNKRKYAKRLYDLSGENIYHLSTYMTGYDRDIVIKEIKGKLKKLEEDYPNMENVPDDRKIIVVSTSLIEAGVDLDFCTVFRELAGLDNILQAGGRCNREGKRQNANVYIFTFSEEEGDAITENQAITKGIIGEFEDISSAESIKAYYSSLYFTKSVNITQNSMAEQMQCKTIECIPFSKYADQFAYIDSASVSVAVAENDESRRLIEQLKAAGFTNHRALQKYTFSVYRYELEDLLKMKAVKDIYGIFCLTNEEKYDRNVGVKFEAQDFFG